MNAILLTIFVGFVLVGFFIALFLFHRRDAETSSAERDSLMPLEDDAWCVVDRVGRGDAPRLPFAAHGGQPSSPD